MNFLIKLKNFASSWSGTIIIVLFLIFFIMQAFVIPTRSMVGTLYEGDFWFVKKFSYGIPTPRIPWIETAILPDFNDNGHLIEGKRPERGDVVVFIPPHIEKTYFVKRAFAIGGDEVIFDDEGLFLRPFEADEKGDEWLKENFSQYPLVTKLSKLFVKEPYSGHLGINYKPIFYDKFGFSLYVDEEGKLYKKICQKGLGAANSGDGEVACEQFAREYINMDNAKIINKQDLNTLPLQEIMKEKDIFIRDDNPIFTLAIQNNIILSGMERHENFYYTKIKPDSFFMIGDNRNNSQDSRFWGSVPYKNIIGKPWFIYFSINQSNSQENRADEIEKNRYTIRWERMFKGIDGLESMLQDKVQK